MVVVVCRGQELMSYKNPEEGWFLDEVPLNPASKVDLVT